MTRIAVVGPGAVGGVIAGWLDRTGRHRIVLCARRVLDGELELDTPDGAFAFRPDVVTDPQRAPEVDFLLVATKAYDAAGAAAWFPALARAGAPVAILQNGVEHRERFQRWIAPDRLLEVMVDVPCERRSPTRFVQRGPGRLVVPAGALGSDFCRLFAGTPLDVRTTDDMTSALWRKLCFNAAGVICALTLVPARVLADPEAAELARAIVRECIAVGRAEGAILEDAIADAVVEGFRRAPPDSINSLHADRAAGRPTEIDARNGAIVRLGRKHGIATPCNAMAVALMNAIARG